jgi:arylsulfatase A-like enzyme
VAEKDQNPNVIGGEKSMKVLFIDIDSIRPDHLGVYGYDAPTSPNIDELADDGIVFNRAYTANSPCMPSRAALLTGRYGLNNGVVTHEIASQTLNSPHTWQNWNGDRQDWWTLPEVLFNNRIFTCAISSFPRHPAPWFYHLWHEFHQPQEPQGSHEYFQTPRAETIVDLSLNIINQNLDDDFFMYVQFWDPHMPYNRSESEIDRFQRINLPKYPTNDQIESHIEWDAHHSAKHMNISSREDLRETLAHYDAEIKYADRNIGRIFEKMKQHGIYDDTLIILTGDHGEEFGEHGLYCEHWSTYEGTQRVPLIIKPPSYVNFTNCTRDELVTNVDLPPTITNHEELQSPSGWQGQSLIPLLKDDVDRWRNHIVVDHGLYTAQRAIRSNKWKLIQTHHPGLWGSVLPEYQLFALDDDPWEQHDLSESHSDIVDELKQKMAIWVTEHLGRNEDELHAVARTNPAGYELTKNDWNGV